jgi:hypothetical protein
MLRQLEAWLFAGRLNDPHGEFMIMASTEVRGLYASGISYLTE